MQWAELLQQPIESSSFWWVSRTASRNGIKCVAYSKWKCSSTSSAIYMIISPNTQASYWSLLSAQTSFTNSNIPRVEFQFCDAFPIDFLVSKKNCKFESTAACTKMFLLSSPLKANEINLFIHWTSKDFPIVASFRLPNDTMELHRSTVLLRIDVIIINWKISLRTI